MKTTLPIAHWEAEEHSNLFPDHALLLSLTVDTDDSAELKALGMGISLRSLAVFKQFEGDRKVGKPR